MRVSNEILEEIKSRISIVDVVGGHVALKRAGKNWKGLCPFHVEKTPSFVVNEDRGTYHCFGCGSGGSVFRFLMEADGLTFPEAVRALAKVAGVALEFSEDRDDGRSPSENEELREILSLASRYYRHQLVEGRAGASARAYLLERNISGEASEQFDLGYAPAGWDALTRYLKKKGFKHSLAVSAGLIVEKSSGKGFYDRLRNRLVFPIADSNGRTVSFGGRTLDGGEPKYLNGPESAVFKKSEILYGLYQASSFLRTSRRALFVEGYLDVIRLHSNGFKAALATLGTALTPAHLRAIRRRADEVVLIYDGDAAGKKAAFRSLDLFLTEGVACRCVILPNNHDPDSFIRSGGDMERLIGEAESLFEVCLKDVFASFDGTRPEGKLAGAEFMIQKLSSIVDPLVLDAYSRRLGEAFNLDERALRARIGERNKPKAIDSVQKARVNNDDPLDKAMLELILNEPGERIKFVSRNLLELMRQGQIRDLAQFVAERSESAESFPIDHLPGHLNDFLAEILVEHKPCRSSFDVLEARLKLRALREKANALTGRIRESEGLGDIDSVSIFLREKTLIDKEIASVESFANQGLLH